MWKRGGGEAECCKRYGKVARVDLDRYGQNGIRGYFLTHGMEHGKKGWERMKQAAGRKDETGGQEGRMKQAGKKEEWGKDETGGQEGRIKQAGRKEG